MILATPLPTVLWGGGIVGGLCTLVVAETPRAAAAGVSRGVGQGRGPGRPIHPHRARGAHSLTPPDQPALGQHKNFCYGSLCCCVGDCVVGHCHLYPLHSWQDILLTFAEMELDSTTMFPPGTYGRPIHPHRARGAHSLTPPDQPALPPPVRSLHGGSAKEGPSRALPHIGRGGSCPDAPKGLPQRHSLPDPFPFFHWCTRRRAPAPYAFPPPPLSAAPFGGPSRPPAPPPLSRAADGGGPHVADLHRWQSPPFALPLGMRHRAVGVRRAAGGDGARSAQGASGPLLGKASGPSPGPVVQWGAYACPLTSMSRAGPRQGSFTQLGATGGRGGGVAGATPPPLSKIGPTFIRASGQSTTFFGALRCLHKLSTTGGGKGGGGGGGGDTPGLKRGPGRQACAAQTVAPPVSMRAKTPPDSSLVH